MNYITFFAASSMLFFYSKSVNSQETFVVSKKNLYHNHKTSGHLKEELGVLLEELAHMITEQIQLLAKAQQQLLHRMRELVDGDTKGAFSGATHKALQKIVQEAQAVVTQAQNNLNVLTKLFNFLKGS
ncbi:MAG: hypothetical protein K2X90_01670 [Candidatus Babeliaceae bacterium]|nr:hypothetical protein [Candidatus Babeliaceae bacterium]